MRTLLRIAVFAVACSGVQAQSPDSATLERFTRDSLKVMAGTISVEVTPRFAGGQLDGCSVGFSALTQDWIYKQGAFIMVGGAFGVMNSKGRFASYLRVTVHDIDPRTMALTPSTPASAYFVADNTTTKKEIISSLPSDLPGSIFVVLHVGPTFQVFGKGLADGKVTIAFARKKDGSDVIVSIDTTVVDTDQSGQRKHSDQIPTDFLKCAQTLQEQSK